MFGHCCVPSCGTTSSGAADSTTFRSVCPLSEMSSACWRESALAEGSVGEQDYSILQVKWAAFGKDTKRLSAALTLSRLSTMGIRLPPVPSVL